MSDDEGINDLVLVNMMSREMSSRIYEIMDIDSTWETIAPHMPEIQQKDVDACRKHDRLGNSPTELLFKIWSIKGYTTNHLYQVFARIKMVRCMRIIKPTVNEKYHFLESRVLLPSKSSKTRAKPPNSAGTLTRFQQASTYGSKNPTADAYRQKAHNTNVASSATSASTIATSEAHDPLRAAIEGTLPVSYSDLQEATDNFSKSNVIGKGGYGVVYKGKLKATGGIVAVKRIMVSNEASSCGGRIENERLRQSLQELRTLARYRHDNILPIYAYSLEGPEPCLVYQFMANGSLEDRLLCRKSTPSLTWTQKREIGLGAARGLLFLHTFAKTPVIHGDVKTANILLDKHMEPKLGDFGLSRDGQIEAGATEKSPLIASHIKGTLAYLPPEFITSKILSTKLDVYSFAIVLLELATGLRAYSDSREPRSLIEYCQIEKARAKEDMKYIKLTMADKKTPSYSDETEENMFSVFFNLGLSGSNHDRLKRPSMHEIVQILSTSSLPPLSNLSL